MQVLLALQVLVTVLLAGLLLLTGLENSSMLGLPWPFSPEVTRVPQGLGLLGFTLLGAVWAALLLLPWLLRLNARRRAAERLLAERERHLQALLQAQYRPPEPFHPAPPPTEEAA